MMEEYCLHNTLQSSQELRIWLWDIGRTRNKVFHFHGQWTSSVLGISSLLLLCLLIRLILAAVSAFGWATSWNKIVPPIGHLAAPGLLESHFIFSGNGLLCLLGENTAEICVLCTPAFPPSVCCSLLGSTRSDLCLRRESPGANLIK